MYNSNSRSQGFSNQSNRYGSNRSGQNRFRGRSQGSRRPRGEYIDVSKYIQKTLPESESESVKIQNIFKDFNFCQELQTNLDKRQYLRPTPIQDQGIMPILQGRDLIGIANTGTGKTAAFLLPLINKVFKNRDQKVLIITPTRELANQIDTEFRAFSENMRLYSTVCVGGMPIGKQIHLLGKGPQFVVGTPGRLKDLSEKGFIKFELFQNIVLDEVDRMLDMGFVNEITKILHTLPKERQTLFFSATLPEKIKNLIGTFLNNPITVAVKTGDTAEGILQDVVRVKDKSEKFDKLQDLLNQPEFIKVLIFSETKWEVEKLTQELTKSGYKAESIHGNKRQNQRERSLTSFRNGNCKVLVATDVAARGLDIKDITHVINYTVPQTYNDYVHRIGRTARGSKSGQALTFIEQVV